MDQRALNQWFDCNQILKLYKNTLIDNGFDSYYVIINNINDEVLQKMNISLYGHRLEILRQIIQLKAAANTNCKATTAFSSFQPQSYVLSHSSVSGNNSSRNAFESNNNTNICNNKVKQTNIASENIRFHLNRLFPIIDKLSSGNGGFTMRAAFKLAMINKDYANVVILALTQQSKLRLKINNIQQLIKTIHNPQQIQKLQSAILMLKENINC
eukprot:280819_1